MSLMKTIGRSKGVWLGGVVALVFVGGCSSARFTDASPSVRTFSDSGVTRTSDYYVGIDLGFVLPQDTPHVPGLPRDDVR